MEQQAIQVIDIHRIAYSTGYLELSRLLSTMELRRRIAKRYIDFGSNWGEEVKENMYKQIEDYNKLIRELLSV